MDGSVDGLDEGSEAGGVRGAANIVGRMDYDHDKVDEAVPALLCLTISEEDGLGARTWKSHDWDALDRLHAKGYISDPKSKAKSVVLSPEGVRRARELFERHFARFQEPRGLGESTG